MIPQSFKEMVVVGAGFVLFWCLLEWVLDFLGLPSMLGLLCDAIRELL